MNDVTPGCSVVILTLNEAANLPGCLDSLAWCDDVVVFDSHSTDATCDIARAAGARVVQRRFDDYASQRNAALREVGYRHDWVLMVDADERVPPDLRAEIAAVTRLPDDGTSLYRMRRKDYFLGRWLRRSSGYPTWFGRLVRPLRVSVARAINEEYLTDGKIGLLQAHLAHYPFNRGLAYWIERHNRYSTLEAEAKLAENATPLDWRALPGDDPVARRRTLKALAYRLPLRPLLVFAYLWILRGGALDGLAGLRFCLLRAWYEWLIDLKVLELSQRPIGSVR